MARRALLDGRRDRSRFAVCDHATPVLYGQEEPGLVPTEGRSPELNPRSPRLHQITELTTAGHEHFVGRTWELAGLGSDFIGSSSGGEAKPVAVITGLGGMGKTALAAEALALWETRFEWVLLYQAKPNPLGFEATLRDIHLKLVGELKLYHEHVKENPADAIYRDATDGFTGQQRLERLTRNLVRALKDEAILLVLDNFETNLKPQAPPSKDWAAPMWACQDPAWDNCLATLVRELVGEASRVLITCRRPLAALAGGASHAVLLGPLPPPEAALYLRSHPGLSRLLFSADAAEKALAMRLLNASRFHPLLMDRLARLATDPALRSQLLKALDTLEQTKDFTQLPALFAKDPGDDKELAYLDDALATSLDQLIDGASPDARRLLWTIAVANEPVELHLLRGVWSGESHKSEIMRMIKRDLARIDSLPTELQQELKALSPELRAMLDDLPPEAPARPEIEPLLEQLRSVGLATEERTGPDDANPDVTCHELVRERIAAWMEQHPLDRAELTPNSIRLAYAERLEAVFHALQQQNMTAALQAGSRAVVYCVQAEAWDRLGSFAGGVVTIASDPRLLEGLIPHLQTAAKSAPEGEPRWSCLCYLADALLNGGRPDTSLPFYEQAAIQARTVAGAGGEDSGQAWSGLGAITGNWANAFRMTGDLDAARQRQLESAAAKKKARRPEIDVIGSELEALRIDIMQGNVDAALPEVETRLAKIKTWWKQHRAGQSVPEAPDAELLARVFIGALDIAKDADYAREDWESALVRLDASLEVERALERPAEVIAATRMNRANVLMQSPGRFGEARAELEACLDAFQNMPDATAKVRGSLADLFNKQGDVAQAITQQRRALALCEQLPDPAVRAISHSNLAHYLERRGTATDLAESRRHEFASLIYFAVSGMGQHLRTWLGNHTVRFRRARAAGTEPAVPRVVELLADPAFHPLEQWLSKRQVGVDELQARVDQLLEHVRRAAVEGKVSDT